MTDGTQYVLDANVFIEAARRYYAFDLVSRFWDILIDHARNGQIQSIDRVRVELERGKDELAKWAKDKFNHAFTSTDDEDVIKSYGEVMAWVQAQSRFLDAAKAEFASSADGWLVAYAKLKGHVVITHEEPAPEAKAKVHIPDVCKVFKVDYCDTFKMLRALGVRLS